MASWAIFGELYSILITYYFGSHIAFSLSVVALAIIGLVVIGAPLRVALLLSLPLVAGLSAGAWFGAENWILKAVLLVIGLIYGFVVIKLFNR